MFNVWNGCSLSQQLCYLSNFALLVKMRSVEAEVVIPDIVTTFLAVVAATCQPWIVGSCIWVKNCRPGNTMQPFLSLRPVPLFGR